MAYQGSCLCGAVRYRIDQLDSPIGHCHCATCRKAHAAEHASTAQVLREHFHWLSGAQKLSAFESSPGKLRRFCSICGTHVVAERAEQPHVILRVATLDEDPGARPSLHIWTAHKVAWLNEAGSVPAYAEWPPG
jgi:ADP-ribosyl-[dinitrogen reductase] hydrolase